MRTCCRFLMREQRLSRWVLTSIDVVLRSAPSWPAMRPTATKPGGLLFDEHLRWQAHVGTPTLDIIMDSPIDVWLAAAATATLRCLLVDHDSISHGDLAGCHLSIVSFLHGSFGWDTILHSCTHRCVCTSCCLSLT